ncbi:MAG: histidine phosphatase family protein [Lachnospiraceae bacterium]|nr:histidine phosphatase family protein [Lachnospiraceae bacterium]
MEIYIVRHGQTIWNAKGLLQGRADIELNEWGRELAGKTGRELEGVHFDIIYSSPLIRAYETACLIRGHRNIRIIRDERLRELCFGVNEGKNFKQLLADPSDDFHYFFDRPELYKAPKEGESFEEISIRAKEFMEEVIEPHRNEYERIMIVGHGALNKAIMRHIRKNDISEYWSGGLQKNCSVSLINLDDDGYHIIEEVKLFY